MALVTALPTAVAAPAPSLPDLGDPTSVYLTPEQEFRLGRAWLRELRGQVGILDDPLVQDYVEHLVYRLASHSDLAEPDLAIIVVNSRDINAFAVPGGVIGLNAGLFLNAESEDEVASVVAHEIAHVSQRHFTRRYADSKRLNAAMFAAMLASLAVAIAGNAEAGMAGIASTQAAAIQNQLAYSRHHEREADRVGMQTLVNAGYDPRAMSRFFERLLRNVQYQGRPPEFILTHPLTEDRVADARSRANAMRSPPLRMTPDFQLAQSRIRARFFSNPQQGLSYFQGLYKGGTSLEQQAAGFGLAVAATRVRQFELAERTLNALVQADPNQLWYRIALAEVANERGQPAQAVTILEDVLRTTPDHYAASVLLARSLISAQRYPDARQVLERQLRRRSDPALWQLLADAAGKDNDLARAHFARAELYFAVGQSDRALEQMRYALAQSNERFDLNAQIRARLRQMEALASERF